MKRFKMTYAESLIEMANREKTEEALEEIRKANSEKRGKELSEKAFMGALDSERVKLFHEGGIK